MLLRDFAAAEQAFSAATVAVRNDYDATVALAVARRAQLVGWPAGPRDGPVDRDALARVEQGLDEAMRLDHERYEAHLNHALLVHRFGEAMGMSPSLRRSVVLQRLRHVAEHSEHVPGCALARDIVSSYLKAAAGTEHFAVFPLTPPFPGPRPAPTADVAEPQVLLEDTNRRAKRWLEGIPPTPIVLQQDPAPGMARWTAKRMEELGPLVADYEAATRAGHLEAALDGGRLGVALHARWAGDAWFPLRGPMGSSDPLRALDGAHVASRELAAEALRLVRRCVSATRGTKHATAAASLCEPWLAQWDRAFVPLHEVWSGAHPDHPYYPRARPGCLCRVSGGAICDACERCAEVTPQLRRCRDGKHATLQGSVMLHARVNARGEVESVAGGSASLAPITSCLKATLEKVTFAPPEQGKAVVSFPITFVD